MKLLATASARRRVFIVLGLAGALLAPASSALAARPRATPTDIPDEEKVVGDNGATTYTAVSADGRLVVAFQSSGLVVYQDAYTSYSSDSDDLPSVSVSGCASPVGLFAAEASSGYVVTLPCSDGKLYQFTVDDSSDSGPFSLSAGDVSTTSPLSEITAATFNPSSGKLFLAGKNTSEVAGLYTVTVSSAGGTASSFATWAAITTTTIERLAVLSDTSVLAVDNNGGVYAVSSGGQLAAASEVCRTEALRVGTSSVAPRDLLSVTDQGFALLLNESDSFIYVIGVVNGAVSTCTAQDWSLDANVRPVSLTRLQVSGTGADTDYIYVRGLTEEGGNIAAYETSAVADPEGPDLQFSTSTTLSSNDQIVASSLSRVYVGTSKGLSVLAAGPWIRFDADAREWPASLSTDGGTLEITLESDETVTAVFYSTTPPMEVSPGDTDDGLEAGVSETRELSSSGLSLEYGENRLFIYTQDENLNLGWTSIRVTVPPATLDDVTVGFGNNRIYIYIPAQDDSVTGFDLVFSPVEFSSAEEFDYDGTSFNVEASNGNIITFPDSLGDTWPVRIAYDEDDPYWEKNTDGSLVYSLRPLQNGQTYYLAIRAVAGGSEGGWSDVLSEMPEATCGAACREGEAGGFCSMVAPGEGGQGGRWRFPIFAILVPAAFMGLRRRRH